MPNPFTQLRAVRENQELSVSDVAELTQIEPHYIEALESAEFSNLPDPIYVRGFIRAYARVLNVAPNPLLSYYKKWEEENQPPSMETSIEVGSAGPDASMSRRTRSRQKLDKKRKAGWTVALKELPQRLLSQGNKWVIAIAVAVVVVGAAAITWTVLNGNEEAKVVSADSETKANESTSPTANNRPKVTLAETSDSYQYGDIYQIENADKVLVKITAKKPTDIRVRAGGPKGEALFDKKLGGNQTVTFSHDKWLSVRLDNPDQVLLFANGVMIDTSAQKEVSLYQLRMAGVADEDQPAQE
ncbi:helix-turn-helix domain-containing protein [Laceyella putida]|uniref:Helix-turn-helix domain-containing protein n=1 Tax=Laceyella putida TaxID=110101 RepID=A0ABW2RKL6_9BACL